MEEEENQSAAASEMRYISLELMKLAQKSGKTFEQLAQEFIENTFRLREIISGEPQKKRARSGKAASSRQK